MRYTLFMHWPEMTPADIGEEEWQAGEGGVPCVRARAGRGGRTRVGGGARVERGDDDAEHGGRRGEGAGRAVRGHEGQIGGTFVIDVPDLDAALAWAEKCPAAQWGTIEIRPSATRFVGGTWVAAGASHG